jgi:hypothetical protein
MPTKFLEMNKSERDEHLKNRYGISNNELAVVRYLSQGNPTIGLQSALELMHEKTGGKEYEITMGKVSNIAFSQKSAGDNNNYAYDVLKRKKNDYRERKKMYKDGYGINVPYLFLLKMDMGLTQSNLLSVLMGDLYRDVKASNDDFIRGISFPRKFNREVSRLLGFIYLNFSKKQEKNNTTTFNNGRIDNFYDDYLSPEILDIFNIHTRKTGDKTEITSKAFRTWVGNSLGFETSNYPFDKFDYDHLGLVEGFISSGWMNFQYDRYLSCIIHEKDNFRLKNAKIIIDKVGFRASNVHDCGDGSYRLDIPLSRDDINEIDLLDEERAIFVDSIINKIPQTNAPHRSFKL